MISMNLSAKEFDDDIESGCLECNSKLIAYVFILVFVQLLISAVIYFYVKTNFFQINDNRDEIHKIHQILGANKVNE